MSQPLLEKILDHTSQTAKLQSTIALLQWDEQTGMPHQAAEYRAQQLMLLTGLVHQRQTDQQLGDWLEQLDAQTLDSSADQPERVIAIRMRREFERSRKLPQSLVEQLARATSIGQQIWVEAKQRKDFSRFLPSLQAIIRLKKEYAACLARPGETHYDALLDDYEQGATTERLREIFSGLRQALVPLIQSGIARSKRLPKSVVEGTFSIDAQRRFSRWVAEKIGFDFQRGRLDETEHPFCTTLGPHDHRILTRFSENSFSSGLFGVLHEAGHGMYEQGLPAEWYGTPLAFAASLGVHESQSRLWENLVGLSIPFWEWAYPHVNEYFPGTFRDVPVSRLVEDLNRVEASLIRIEADEVTYNMHILIRFEMELALVDGDLKAEDLPQAWKEKMEAYLGIVPSDDSTGALQDVHWSAGLFGYFPTYTLGNIYSAQLFQAANRDLGGLSPAISKGDFQPLLEWLRSRIHRHGQTYLPMELIERATGEPVQSKYLIEHLATKC